MRKSDRQLLILLLLPIVLFSAGTRFVNANVSWRSSGPFRAISDLCSQNSGGCGTDFAWAHKMFYAQAHWWIIYPKADTTLVYSSSVSGSGPWIGSDLPSSPTTGEAVEYAIDNNATTVFVVANGVNPVGLFFWHGTLNGDGTIAWSSRIAIPSSTGYTYVSTAFQKTTNQAYVFVTAGSGCGACYFVSTNLAFTTWSPVQMLHNPSIAMSAYSTTDTTTGLYVIYYAWYGNNQANLPGVFGRLLNGVIQGTEETIPYPLGVQNWNGLNTLDIASHTSSSVVPGQSLIGAYSTDSIIASYPSQISFDKNQTSSDEDIPCCSGTVAVPITPSQSNEFAVLSIVTGDSLAGAQPGATISLVTDTGSNSWTKQVAIACSACGTSPTDVEVWTASLASASSDTITATLDFGTDTDSMAVGMTVALYQNVASIGNNASLSTSTNQVSYTISGPTINSFQQSPDSLVVGVTGIDLSGSACTDVVPGTGQTQRGQDHLCGGGTIAFDTEEEPGSSSVTYSSSWTGGIGAASTAVVFVGKVPSQNNGVDAVGSCFAVGVVNNPTQVAEIDVPMNGTGIMSARAELYVGTPGSLASSTPAGPALSTSQIITNLPHGSTPTSLAFTFSPSVTVTSGSNWCWVVEGLSRIGSATYSLMYAGTAQRSFYWNGTVQAWQTGHAATNGYPLVTVKQFSIISNFANAVNSWLSTTGKISAALGYANNGFGNPANSWGTNAGNTTYGTSVFYTTRSSAGVWTIPSLPGGNPNGWCITYDPTNGYSYLSAGSGSSPIQIFDPNFIPVSTLTAYPFLLSGGGGSGEGNCPQYTAPNGSVLIGRPNGTATAAPQIWITEIDLSIATGPIVPPGLSQSQFSILTLVIIGVSIAVIALTGITIVKLHKRRFRSKTQVGMRLLRPRSLGQVLRSW